MDRLSKSAKSVRFAAWPRWAARAMLALVAGALVLAALVTDPQTGEVGEETATVPSPAIEDSEFKAAEPARDTDLALYDAVIERMTAGEGYYEVVVEAQRARDFPVRPGLAVRLPTLATASAWLGPAGLLAAAALLVLATLWAWWRKLGADPLLADKRLVAIVLLAIGIFSGFKPTYFALHEAWAGVLLALSFGLHRRDGERTRWVGAWIAAAAALAIRELALPFVLLMGALALYRREWREGAAWALLAALFALGLWLHLSQVAALTSPADPASPSWLALRGLAGWTESVTLTTILYRLPGWLAGPLAVLPLLGWAAWNARAGLFGLCLFTGYALLLAIGGRENNFYWALMVVPAYFVGLVLVPRAFATLTERVR